MTRHAKNCTAGSVYTYHERQKDTSQSGYGSKSVRLGKDSIKEFDCCSLTLQPCRNAVVTLDGYIYDKEVILEYILHKKADIRKKLKEFEKQSSKFDKEAAELYKAEKESHMQKFVAKQTIGKPQEAAEDAKASTSKGSLCNMHNGKDKKLPSFWIPTLTPKAKETALAKPDEKVRCPMTGKPIKLKDLIDVHFTEIKDGDTKKSLITKDARYVCAVSNDVLSNAVPCAVLRTSGNVVTLECLERIIKKDMVDPTNGKKLTEKDIINIQRGATGFSGEGVKLDAKRDGAALQV